MHIRKYAVPYRKGRPHAPEPLLLADQYKTTQDISHLLYGQALESYAADT